MKTAEKKKTSVDTEQNLSSPSSVGGFGKVLNSIQGLQQRLDDFSIEMISSAEANANTLIRSLALLQAQLDQLAALKRSLAAAEAMIEEIPETGIDPIGPSALDKHPQLRAIVSASKIIRLHKLLKVARASVESVSLDTEFGRLDIVTPLIPAIAPGGDRIGPDPSAKSQPEAKTEKPATTRDALKKSSSEVIELPPPPASEDPFHDPIKVKGESYPPPAVKDTSSIPSSSEAQAAASEFANPSTIDATMENQTVPAPELPSSTILSTLPIVEPDGQSAEARAGADSAIPLNESERKFKAAVPPEAPQAQQFQSVEVAAPEFDDERVGPVMNATIDQRLLDELIQNYGEFAPLAKSSVPRPALQSEAVPTAADPHKIYEFHSSPSAERVEPTVSLEPEFVGPVPLQIIEAVAVEPSEINVPSVRAQEDLDRQLKKIIKDYGEYDIYAQQSSPALKRSGIAAFIVLALVLGAVYFLRGPAQTAPAAVNSVSQPGGESSPGGPQTTIEKSRAVEAGGNTAGELKQKGKSENASTAEKAKLQQKP